MRLVWEINPICLQELSDIDYYYRPSVTLDAQRNLKGASVHVFKLFVNVAQADLGQTCLVHHIIHVQNAILTIWFAQDQINKLASQS